MGQFFTRRRLGLILALLILSMPFIALSIQRFVEDANRANLTEDQIQATVDAQLTDIAVSSATPTLDSDERVEATLTAMVPTPDVSTQESAENDGGIGGAIGRIISGILSFTWGIIIGTVTFFAGLVGGLFGSGVTTVTMCCGWMILIGGILVVVGAANGGL